MSPRSARVGRLALGALAALSIITATAGAGFGIEPSPSASPASSLTPALPVTVLIDSMEPKAPTPQDTLRIEGRIQTPDEDVFDLAYSVRMGQVLSRFDLHRLRTTPETPQGLAGTPINGPEQLLAGSTAKFRINLPLKLAPFLGTDGVHALRVVVTGHTKDGATVPIGMADTFLPVFGGDPGPAPTRIVWGVPIGASPQAQPRGAISDPSVLGLLGPQGRLSRVLAAATSTAGAQDSVQGSAAPAVTLIIDPDVLRALQAATRPRWQLPGSDDEHRPSNAAIGFLTALTRVAKNDTVIALPSSEADVVSLVEAGLEGEAVRAIADGRSGVLSVLGVQARADIVAPALGLLSSQSIDFYKAQGASTLLLNEQSLPPLPNLSITPTALAEVHAEGDGIGAIGALVGDQYLNDLVALGDKSAPTARMAEQLFLAETAMITSQRPAISQSLLVLPPRDWDPGQRFGRAVIADSAAVPWLKASSIDEVSAGLKETGLRQPVVTTLTTLLSPEVLGTIAEARTSLDNFAQSFSSGAIDTITNDVQRALFAAESARWRGEVGEALSRANVAIRAVEGLRGSVRAAAPRVVTLTSESSPVPVTVINELPLSVTVKVRIQSTNRTRLSSRTGYTQTVTIGPNSKVRVDIPVKVESSGTFPVTVGVETLSGTSLGPPAKFVVRSAAYGKVALWITGGGLGILLIAIVRRWLRRLRGSGKPPRNSEVLGDIQPRGSLA